MNDFVHQRRTDLLGAYVLDHLAEPELTAVRDHLDACADCRRTVAELTPVARALSGVNADDVTVPAHLEELVVRRVGAHRGRRLRRSLLLAAAAAAVIAGGAAWWYLRPTAPLEPVALVLQAPGVTAEASLVPHTWGVEIKLDGQGFVSGQTYRVAVTGTDGSEVSAGSFIGTGENPMRCNLNSSVLRANASGLVVRDAAGTVALTSTFPRR
ncbi:anti-sigma factor family protein [Lentzea albida]|uniref:Putative zinc-finger n=1 Tax=Lentzea albida TaxID=65499 RepID=A0A1H9U7Z4_9PSEU|nr:zf-HC2 domain-containing protein [Lentzea albida]SES05223.1 Putative zinc-finger [Lentzea albida]